MATYTAEIATNRFGMGAKEGELLSAKSQPQEWLLQQIRPLTFSPGFTESNTALSKVSEYRLMWRQAKKTVADKPAQPKNKMPMAEDPIKRLRKSANQYALQLSHNTCLLYTSPSPRDRG